MPPPHRALMLERFSEVSLLIMGVTIAIRQNISNVVAQQNLKCHLRQATYRSLATNLSRQLCEAAMPATALFWMHQHRTRVGTPIISMHRDHTPSYVLIPLPSALLSPHQAFALGAGPPKRRPTHTRIKLLGGNHVTAWLSSRLNAYWPLRDPLVG